MCLGETGGNVSQTVGDGIPKVTWFSLFTVAAASSRLRVVCSGDRPLWTTRREFGHELRRLRPSGRDASIGGREAVATTASSKGGRGGGGGCRVAGRSVFQ